MARPVETAGRRLALVLAAAVLASCALAPPANDAARYAAIVAAPDRSEADHRTDVRRHPAEMLAFTGAQPGMLAEDLSAGGGYSSELLARAVAPGGKVYAQSPRPGPALAERARRPALAAVLVPVARPFEDPVPPEVRGHLDLVTIMFNYHDLGHMGVDRARMNQAVFDALKPGGTYVIADHSGRPGTGISESGTLHRVEEAFVVREVQAAGFRLAATGDFLRNPADPRDRNTPEPPMPKDEFVLKFVKPH
jgi:predicted methyltransferase